jgi:hypothetical protein
VCSTIADIDNKHSRDCSQLPLARGLVQIFSSCLNCSRFRLLIRPPLWQYSHMYMLLRHLISASILAFSCSVNRQGRYRQRTLYQPCGDNVSRDHMQNMFVFSCVARCWIRMFYIASDSGCASASMFLS